MIKIIFISFALNLFGQQIDGLKCYQGQQNISAELTSSPTDCPMAAYSCIASADWTRNVIIRACMSVNCSSAGGYKISPTPLCIVSMSYPKQTFCCCYGDGCNVYTNLTNPNEP